MYSPKSFVVDDQCTLHEFLRRYSFATVVSCADQEPVVSHLPLLLDSNEGDHGRLIGHMAKANPHWKVGAGRDALCIFNGPHTYISPSWYEDRNVVPTWNYVAVHARGLMKLITDREKLHEIVEKYVDNYEAVMPSPWSMTSADDDFVWQLVDGIVGFTIDIESLKGKWKLSQNHSEERRQRVIRALRERDQGDDGLVADMMEER